MLNFCLHSTINHRKEEFNLYTWKKRSTKVNILYPKYLYFNRNRCGSWWGDIQCSREKLEEARTVGEGVHHPPARPPRSASATRGEPWRTLQGVGAPSAGGVLRINRGIGGLQDAKTTKGRTLGSSAAMLQLFILHIHCYINGFWDHFRNFPKCSDAS